MISLRTADFGGKNKPFSNKIHYRPHNRDRDDSPPLQSSDPNIKIPCTEQSVSMETLCKRQHSIKILSGAFGGRFNVPFYVICPKTAKKLQKGITRKLFIETPSCDPANRPGEKILRNGDGFKFIGLNW